LVLPLVVDVVVVVVLVVFNLLPTYDQLRDGRRRKKSR
jgi:hypothetical protein